MADKNHETADMDLEAHEKTFAGFMRWVTNAAIVILIVLVLLAITGT